ncbi:PREDICTED: transmembrane protein 183-like isoform X2 [Wasmannia auropunctata]|uniref:transmembrane protein 183-like isoform X2 n=1 Tax=Wasmannia auropunctata TaxID=64793 RepID=UPI0005EE36AC|nr:PREDICTED: transmembrane protein 183-like isoform X2 [Wasmannia auropunctata]
MSALRKKAGRRSAREARADNLVGDVTIDDFANTLRLHARFKKSVTNVSNEVKQKAAKQDEKSTWDETDEENLMKDSTKGRRNRRKSKCQQDNDEEEGVDYPLDIWFIISEYIQPEAVGKFARICKSSYYVTTTGKFWFHLYKLYYKFVPDLPERLRPQCMRLHGLRASVIRALHYSYFRTSEGERDDMSYLRQEEPHSLVKRKCTLMWHKEGKVRWYFYFKLKEISKTRNSSLKSSIQCGVKKTEFLEMLEDVAVNPEDGCKVLRVSCLKYSMLPPVIGLVLQTVSMNLMPGFREYRLQLGFGTSDVPSTLTNQIILRNVIGCSIFNWWDSAYPHQDVGYTIELPQNDSWD